MLGDIPECLLSLPSRLWGELMDLAPKPPWRWGDLSWTEQIHDCVGEELDTGEDRY